MADYEYAIGTAADNLQNLEDDLGVPPPHPAPHIEWGAEYQAGDGLVYGDGWPSVVWHFDFLSATHLAALRTYCTGKSAQVYIKTLEPDLTTYGTYQAIMVWPTGGEYRVGRAKTDFEIRFTHLEEV